MGTVIIGEREFEVELPFHLDVLEAAADAIDRSNRAVEELMRLQAANRALLDADPAAVTERIPLALTVRVLSSSVEALHVAIQRANPGVTLEEIRGLVTLDDAGAVSNALNKALSRSGFGPKGEPKAPLSEAAPRPSKARSKG